MAKKIIALILLLAMVTAVAYAEERENQMTEIAVTEIGPVRIGQAEDLAEQILEKGVYARLH